MNPEKPTPQEYRDNLAELIKNEPDKQKRREILGRAKEGDDYQEARQEKISERELTPEVKKEIEEYYPFAHKFNKQYVEAANRIDTRLAVYNHVNFEKFSDNEIDETGLSKPERNLVNQLWYRSDEAALYAEDLNRSKTGQYTGSDERDKSTNSFCERIKHNAAALSLLELPSLEEYNPEHIETEIRTGDLRAAAFSVLYGILHRDKRKGIDFDRAFSDEETSSAGRFVQRLFSAIPLKNIQLNADVWPLEITAKFNASFGMDFEGILDFYEYTISHPEILKDAESVHGIKMFSSEQSEKKTKK